MEIYRYLLDLLPTYHSTRLTLINACNRLANKCSLVLDERYQPTAQLSSKEYPKSATTISAFDVDEALNLISQAENALHRRNVLLSP
jgi:hypothetical protein